jgi:hypothetical protein
MAPSSCKLLAPASSKRRTNCAAGLQPKVKSPLGNAARFLSALVVVVVGGKSDEVACSTVSGRMSSFVVQSACTLAAACCLVVGRCCELCCGCRGSLTRSVLHSTLKSRFTTATRTFGFGPETRSILRLKILKSKLCFHAEQFRRSNNSPTSPTSQPAFCCAVAPPHARTERSSNEPPP